MLEARNITGSRSERQLFQDLNLEARPAQVVYIRGHNGAGKTTLLRMLCGLIRPDSGQILWNRTPIGECQPEFVGQLAYVGHENGIKGDLTPLENLDFYRRIKAGTPGISPAQALEELDAGVFSHVPCRHLSAGQQRRVALARLLVIDARLWMLDEPFTALDSSAREIISNLIARHLESDGLCVATSHQPLDYRQFSVAEITLGTAS